MAITKFSELRNSLKEGQVLLPGDDGYEESLERWSLTCVKPAAAVAKPKSAEEVSQVIKFAVKNNIQFNVKGGGHSTSMASAAPSPDGMVLDLGNLRSVHVDTEAYTVSFGGGCLWRDVDDALWPHRLATPGGTISHTGVGGLILHGGFGILSGLHGLALDCLIECEVVLADGSVVRASEQENSDLFWGLRGAGSSFGVVTKFTSKVFPQGDIYGGITCFTSVKLSQVVDFFNHWKETNTGYETVSMLCTYMPVPPGQEAPPGGPPPVILVLVAHLGKDAEAAGPKYFQPLLDIGPVFQHVDMMPYPQYNKLSDEAHASNRSRYLVGGSNFTFPVSTSTFEQVVKKFWATTPPAEGMGGSAMLWEGISKRAIGKVPVDSTAFNSRGNYYNIAIILEWEDEKMDREMRARVRSVATEARVLGYNDDDCKDGVEKYLNYESTGEGIAAEKAFGAHAARLRGLKKKYDPGNVFDKLWKLVGKVEEQFAGPI